MDLNERIEHIEYSDGTRYSSSGRQFQIVRRANKYNHTLKRDVLNYEVKELPDVGGKRWTIDTYLFSQLVHNDRIHILLYYKTKDKWL